MPPRVQEEQVMPPNPLRCPVPDCNHVTPEGIPSFELMYQDLALHTRYGHPDPAPAAAQERPHNSKPKDLPRPTVDEGITEADWNHFTEKWSRYKRSCLANAPDCNIQDQLWACCSEQLEKSVYNSGINASATEVQLLSAMRELAVRKQNILVNVVNFLRLGQNNSESAGSFTARLKGQARICNFTLPQGVTDYSEKMVTHQLIRGLADPVIQEQVLAHSSTNKDMQLDAILQFIQAKESGKQDSGALAEGGGGGLCRISDFKKSKTEESRNKSQTLPSTQALNTQKCQWCNESGHGPQAPEEQGKAKCKAYGKICSACSKANHLESVCRSKKRPANLPGTTNHLGTGTFCCISTPQGPSTRLSHHSHTQFRGWAASRPEEHPTMTVTCSVAPDAYAQLGIKVPRVTSRNSPAPSLADTGAQMCVAGPSLLHSLGCTKRELIKLQGGVSTADNAGLTLLGGIFIKIKAVTPQGALLFTEQLVYIAEGINTLFLSKSACRDLGIIGENFPEVGSHTASISSLAGSEETKGKQQQHKQCTPYGPQDSQCNCPRRTPTPDPPELPCSPTSENLPKLKAFILDYYKTSAFNQCETQPLPLLTDSPPLQLHIDPAAKPVACHRPRPVPMHWLEEVKEGLDRDCRIGVLEKVPVGTPTTWCAPMVTVAKHDGTPRRTVDFQKINEHSVRQTHPTTAPYIQASSIPANTKKTVLDVWNSYHSVPIAKNDVEAGYTTFITPWGRYRYLTSPQGFLAAGDGFTNRYDMIIEGIEDYTKCVDDTCLWAEDIGTSFNKACRYISIAGKGGIIFNRKKFQFSEDEVDFVGFRVTKDSVKPGLEFVNSIRDFPRPTDITGIRSWFGLVNQLAFTFSSTATMEPFRTLLKPSSEFLWTDKMQEAFVQSKEHLISAIHEGVRIYDPQRTTALLTDWSKVGIGFVLTQKYCSCPGKSPICCSQGWRVTYCGSRFNSPAESRYDVGSGLGTRESYVFCAWPP